MAGRASIEMKARELGMSVSASSEPVAQAIQRIKDLESRGYAFERADASFELLLREELAGAPPVLPLRVDAWDVAVSQRPGGGVHSEATIQLHVDGAAVTVTSTGKGPVNALDGALREALGRYLPGVAWPDLIDYQVRILPGDAGSREVGSAAMTRVLTTFCDGTRQWTTVGVDENVVAASWAALWDAVGFVLSRGGRSESRVGADALAA
jgi:2-isopropylmalate synthase